jgi:hypothetical protein
MENPMETPISTLPPTEPPDRVNNGLAVAAGAFGIGSIVAQLLGLVLTSVDPTIQSLCSGIGGIAWLAGIVLGIVGLVQIKRHPGQKGKGWAITGIVLGVLRICIVVVSVLLLAGPTIGTIATKISATMTAP